MLPAISVVNSVELIRDGGSLAASFLGENGSEYWLFYRLLRRTLASGMVERLGYAKPVVVERQSGIEIEISWEHALILINQIRPLLRQIREKSARTRLRFLFRHSSGLAGCGAVRHFIYMNSTIAST